MKINSLVKKIRKQRQRRLLRVRRPMLENRGLRLSVYRSGRYIYAQIIDDQKNITMVSTSDLKIKTKISRIERAKVVGKTLAELAKKKKIKTVVFDRGWYKFHGRIKALADSGREHGLEF